jgi:hypothetical protein
MPKAKTMLDELARVLKARKNAVSRFDRRWGNWPEPRLGKNGLEESRQLVDDLGDRAVMEYDRLMRSNPSRRDMQKAWDMLPDELVREHDYFDR